MQPREVTVASASQPGEQYRVLVGIDGEASCTCAGYEYRQSCRHIKEIKERHIMSDNESTALVPLKVEPPRSILPTRDELSVIGLIAKSVVSARGHAVPKEIDSSAKAAAVMLAGHELGVKPMSALRHILVVNGKTEPDAQLMAGIVIAHEPDATIEVVVLTDTECTMRITRPSRGIKSEYTYTIEDARKAQLVKPGGNWEKFPKDMLRWAATKRLCRAYAPDLINSVGAVEVSAVGELMETVATEASFIDAEPVPARAVESLPAGSLYNDGDDEPGDIPANVDVVTGEIVEDEAPVAAPAVPGWKLYMTAQMKETDVTVEDLCVYLGCEKASLNQDIEAWLRANGGLDNQQAVDALLGVARDTRPAVTSGADATQAVPA